jgi:hypothetical protein
MLGFFQPKKSVIWAAVLPPSAALVADVLLKLWNVYREGLARLSRVAMSWGTFEMVFLPIGPSLSLSDLVSKPLSPGRTSADCSL